MTSTVSFKDKLKQAYSVFKWDMKSCTGTMAVYAILAAVFTTIILTLCLVFGFYSQDSLGLYDSYSYVESSGSRDAVAISVRFFQIIASGMIYFLTIIFAIIYTVKVYSYLHNKRMTDLYGSLPISRVMLFVSKSASAYLFTLVPAMFFLGIIFIISICFGQPIVNEAINFYVKLLIGTLASISAYGLISICCGTTLNSVIMFIAVCIAYPLSAMFIKAVAGGFFYGTYSGVFKDHFIMNALNPLAAYDGINIIYWLIFSAVCIVGSAFLVKKRKAERAQASFAYYLPCHIVKVLVSFLAGMFLGVLFGSLNVFNYPFAGFVFGFVLGSVPAFVIAHLIFYKGFSQLIKTSIPLGGLIVAVIAAMAVCNYDVFGYNEFVPESDNVKSAGLIDINNSFCKNDSDLIKLTRNASEDFTEKSDIDSIIVSHSEYLSNTVFTSEKKFQSVWYNMFVDNFPIGINTPKYCFAYKLNNGRVVTRIYSNSFYSNDFNRIIDTSKIVKTKEYTEKYSAIMNANQDDFTGVGVRIDDMNYCSANDSEQSEKDFAKVIEAFKKDFEADKSDCSKVLAPLEVYNVYDYLSSYHISETVEEYKETYPDAVCMLKISADRNNTIPNDVFTAITSGGYSFWGVEKFQEEEYLIPQSYTNTIKALKEIGVLNSDNTLNKESDYYYYGEY